MCKLWLPVRLCGDRNYHYVCMCVSYTKFGSKPCVPLCEFRLCLTSRVLLNKTKAGDDSALIVLAVNRSLQQADR